MFLNNLPQLMIMIHVSVTNANWAVPDHKEQHTTFLSYGFFDS